MNAINHVDTPGFSKKPIPTKFKPTDERILEDARKSTGFTNAELIRRAVRLMGREKKAVSNYGFLLQLTA